MTLTQALYRLHKLRFKRKLRKNLTPAEQKLWQELRNRKFHDMKWRRQADIGVFIVDFVCPHYHLIIEVDGEIHKFQQEYDHMRTDILVLFGYRVIRFTNNEVLHELPVVLEKILSSLSESSPRIHP